MAELQRAGIRLTEVALDGGFNPGPTEEAFGDGPPRHTFIAGRREPDSRRSRRRLARYRTGAEGRIPT